MYQYKMVQVPPNIEVLAKESGSEAAVYLEDVVNSQAAEGWEFHRVDEIGVLVKAGCLMRLIGREDEYRTYYVISFRRQSEGNVSRSAFSGSTSGLRHPVYGLRVGFSLRAPSTPSWRSENMVSFGVRYGPQNG